MDAQPADTVDAVVVGAGPNGLVAANLLVDAGWDVLVLEASDAPGGAVRSAELIEPGFVNDLASAFYPLGVASPILAGLDLDVQWRHAPLPLAHVLPDDRCAVVSRTPERTAASLAAFDPGDGDRWLAEYERWQRIGPDLLAAIFTPFPPVRAGARLARRLGAAEGLRFARLAVTSARAFDGFRGEGARLLLAGNALHTDLGPERGGGAVFGWLLCMLAQDVGFPAVAGGAGALTEALARRFTAAGGRIECGRAVSKVLVADGRALGVADAQGDAVRAQRAVLATVPAPTLYRDLVGPQHLPARLVADLDAYRPDDATIKVDWTLSGPIPWLAPDARSAGTVHLDLDLAGMSRFASDLASGVVPERPFVLLGQMTLADPTRSPGGTETAWAYTHVPPGEPWHRDDLNRAADRLEDLVDRHAPGFRSLVRGRHVRHVAAGAVNGGTAGLSQQLFFRPVPGLARADTPIDRLFLAGASAHPGGAVHGGPGANAARAALSRNGIAGPVYRALVNAAHRAIYR